MGWRRALAWIAIGVAAIAVVGGWMIVSNQNDSDTGTVHLTFDCTWPPEAAPQAEFDKARETCDEGFTRQILAACAKPGVVAIRMTHRYIVEGGETQVFQGGTNTCAHMVPGLGGASDQSPFGRLNTSKNIER